MPPPEQDDGRVERGRKLRSAFTYLLASALAAGSAAAASSHRPGAVNFPGDGVQQVASPTGVVAYYVDPGPDSGGSDERPILLRYPNGRIEQIDTFGRNADVSWSPLGDHLVVTNWIGSNVADCSAVTPSPSGARKRSMTSAINASRLQAVARDTREGDHVYVSCKRWISPDRVEVEVNGYGCNRFPCTPRSFDHALVYDFRTDRVSRSGP